MRRAVLAAVAVLAMSGAAIAGQPAGSSRAGAQGDANDHVAAPADGSVRNEPAVAVSPSDPRRVITAANTLTSEYYTGVNTSHDGGQTFVGHRMPAVPGAPVQMDPSLSFDGRGRLYVGYVAYDRTDHAAGGFVVVRSDDGGDSWPKKPTIASHHTARADRCTMADFPSVAADPRPGHQDVYAAWQRTAQSGNSCTTHDSTTVMWSVSRDGGRTWAIPAEVPMPPRLGSYLPTISVGPDGTVVITSAAYSLSASLSDATLACPSAVLPLYAAVAVSHDGARTFSPHVAQSYCAPGIAASASDPVLGASISSYTGSTSRLPANSNTVVDPKTGRLINVAGGQDPHTGQQVAYIATSVDGVSWTTGGVVAGLPAENQQSPRLAVGPDGHLSLLYMAQLPGGLLQATHAVSVDGGRSWSAPERLTALPARSVAPFWLGFMGDYFGNAVGSDGLAHPVWTDVRQTTDPRSAAFGGGQIYTKAVRT